MKSIYPYIKDRPPRRRPKPVLRSYLWFWFIGIVHLAAVLGYKFNASLSITAHRFPDNPAEYWDGFWQTLPLASLRGNLIESIWNLHSQPPLLNLYGGVLAKLFYPHHLEWMHYINIVLGSCIPAMLGVIVWRIARNRPAGFIVAVIYALNPSLFLYEAYPLYTLPTAFLVTASVFCLAMFVPNRRTGWLYAFIVFVNLLILTRSAYHLAILAVAVPFVVLLADAKRLKVAVISLAVCLPSVGWYAKNYAKFGFFGASSWTGQGLWRITGKDYPQERKEALLAEGVIEPAAARVHPFTVPSVYQPYGFEKTSDVRVLNNDDFNNINMIEISRSYQRSALGLMRRDPGNYARNVCRSYRFFCVPSSQYPQVSANAEKIPRHEWISSRVFQGQWPCEYLAGHIGADIFGSLLFFVLPLTVLAHLFSALWRCRVSPAAWGAMISRDPVTAMAMFLIVYSTLVCCAAEFGENMRFKFLIEAMLWGVPIGIALRFFQGRRLAGDDLQWAPPGI